MPRISVLILTLFLAGCAVKKVTQPEPLRVQVARDKYWEPILVRRLEPSLRLKKDVDVTAYLQRLTRALMGENQILQNLRAGVFLIENRRNRWMSYALPGIRIYLSAEMIQAFEFENELAALISFQLAHILNSHLTKKIEKQKMASGSDEIDLNVLFPVPFRKKKEIDYTISGRGFAYSSSELAASAQTAVGILYRAGYDPRGMVSLWRALLQNSKTSPYSKSLLESLIDQTYNKIVEYSPLRNPIVRSDEFIRIRNRIRDL